MSTLTSLARARAFEVGRAVPIATVSHVHLAARPMVFIPLTLAGEANAPLAAMFGTSPDAPSLLIVPQPRNRDLRFAFAGSLAPAIIDHAYEATRGGLEAVGKASVQTDAPQIIVPNPGGVAFLRLFGRSTRFRRTTGEYAVPMDVPMLGRWLTYFAERFEHPGACTTLAMTTVLSSHWATGQSGLEDGNLAALMGWIDPPQGLTGPEAAAQAEDPTLWPPAGPATDPLFDNEVLASLVRAHDSASDPAAQTRAIAAMEAALRGELEPTWRLMWRAIDLLRAMRVGQSVEGRWLSERREFTRFLEYTEQGGFPQGKRDGAVLAARRLNDMERELEVFDAMRAFDDALVMAEYRASGEAFAGEVVECDPGRLVGSAGKRRVLRPLITVRTADPVRLEAGASLQAVTRPGQTGTIQSVSGDGDGIRVVLELSGGMGGGHAPRPGTVPELGERLCYSTLKSAERAVPDVADPRGDAMDTWRTARGVRPDRRGRGGSMVMTLASPAEDAERVIAEVLADLRHGANPGVVVDSPPGAGKSTLVVRAAGQLALDGGQVMIVAQTNEQVDDLVVRLADAMPNAPIGRLSATDYLPSDRVRSRTNVTVRSTVADLATAAVLVGTASKWTFVTDGRWRWAIVDEAYQMRSDMLLRIAPRFERALFVGDPGQLDPFATIDVERWLGLSWDPMQSAVAVLLRHNPSIVPHRLPVSWRLPATAAPVVAEAFYPFAPFVSGTAPDERRLTFASSGIGARELDPTLEMAAKTGWALHRLRARHTLRTDAEAVQACADLAVRLVQRQAVAHSPDRSPGGEPVNPERIAIGTAHRDQAAAIRSALGHRLPGITVDTANRLQGREYDVTIVLHPLSGRLDATAFHLESGRLCVLTSRHRHACIVVARDGIQELLDAHPSTEPVHLNVPVKFPDGWEAHQALLTHLHSK